MLKNTNSKAKCARIGDINNYKIFVDNLSNPYDCNFGTQEKNYNPENLKKLHNKTTYGVK